MSQGGGEGGGLGTQGFRRVLGVSKSSRVCGVSGWVSGVCSRALEQNAIVLRNATTRVPSNYLSYSICQAHSRAEKSSDLPEQLDNPKPEPPKNPRRPPPKKTKNTLKPQRVDCSRTLTDVGVRRFGFKL